MKKAISVVLAMAMSISMMLSLTACGQSNEDKVTSGMGNDAIVSSSEKISKEFKDSMDSYEEFFDKYVAIMKKYKNNPTDTSILTDYTKYMGQYTEMMADFEKWEGKDLNTAETAYYIEVQGRITQKLLEVAQ